MRNTAYGPSSVGWSRIHLAYGSIVCGAVIGRRTEKVEPSADTTLDINWPAEDFDKLTRKRQTMATALAFSL